jgi:hypothetical protein
MVLFSCPYLGSEVELIDECEQHIAEQHPDLLPAHRQKIADTLAEPDQVRRSTRFGNTRLFSRWFAELRGAKHVVVVIVSHYGSLRRHFTVTGPSSR